METTQDIGCAIVICVCGNCGVTEEETFDGWSAADIALPYGWLADPPRLLCDECAAGAGDD